MEMKYSHYGTLGKRNEKEILGEYMPGDWMNLSQVSKILGVHPSTVRNWSDQGHLPVHRTKGGHRRYRRSEVELWLQSQREDVSSERHVIVQNALKRTRIQISEGRLESESWYQKLDDEAREQYRLSGRDLLQGLSGYLANDGEDVLRVLRLPFV